MKKKRRKESYHTHTTISDGKLSPKELIELSIEKEFSILAITDHYPRPIGIEPSGWGTEFYTDVHYNELKKLKEKYKDKIKILIGAEFDWFPNKINWIKKALREREYDIKIISVHCLLINEKYYVINYTQDYFEEALNALNGDIKELVKIYYKTLREGIKSGWFDIVGHFDVIKTLNERQRYFSEAEDWYKNEVLQTLDLIKQCKMKMEINFQYYLSEGKEQFPSSWIISQACKRRIPVVIGTDAHNREGVDYDLQEIEKIIRA